jgi:hypothetical protein
VLIFFAPLHPLLLCSFALKRAGLALPFLADFQCPNATKAVPLQSHVANRE